MIGRLEIDMKTLENSRSIVKEGKVKARHKKKLMTIRLPSPDIQLDRCYWLIDRLLIMHFCSLGRDVLGAPQPIAIP